MTMYRMQQREMMLALVDGDAGAARALLDLAARHTEDVFRRAHAHPAGAADDDRALPAGGRRAARARHRRGCARPTRAPTRIRSAPARSPAPGFPIDRDRTTALLGFDGPTGNTYGSIATVDYLLESVSAAAVLLVGPGPRRPGPAAVVHDASSATCAWRTGSSSAAASCRRSATPWRSSTRARSPARRSARRRRSCSPSTTRRSATSSIPKTICSRSSPRCSATPSGPYGSSRRR